MFDKTTQEYVLMASPDLEKKDPDTATVIVAGYGYSYDVRKGKRENEIILSRTGKMADGRIIHYQFDPNESADWRDHIGDAVVHVVCTTDDIIPVKPFRMVCY